MLTRLERENETLREFAEAKEPGSSMLVTRISNLREENDRLGDALGKALDQVRGGDEMGGVRLSRIRSDSWREKLRKLMSQRKV